MTEPLGAGGLVEEILGGRAPERIRAAAARGALPLPRAMLVRLYVHLLRDDLGEIREAAQSSIEELGEGAVRECLMAADCDPQVLSHFAGQATRNDALAEPIVFHSATPETTLAQLAGRGSNSVVDLVLTNQERLLAQPRLLEGLMANPSLRPDQRGRILELLERAARRQDEAPEPETDGEPIPEGVEEVANLLDVDVGDLLSASEIVDGEEFAESPEIEIRSAYQKIITLNTAQKAILAMKGGREERTILIRDSNKTVSMGVLKNPRISDPEIESIACMRNVAQDILRVLANRREWVKSYKVVLGLVTNPRTPQAVATNFVSRLTNRDLRNVIGSREIPELIRRMARRTYDIRTKPAKSAFRK